jgi:hypothetical protein
MFSCLTSIWTLEAWNTKLTARRSRPEPAPQDQLDKAPLVSSRRVTCRIESCSLDACAIPREQL